MSIVTNQDALKNRIESEVNRILAECQERANNGYKRCYVTVDRDIYRTILDELEKHKVCVVVTIHRYGPSTRAIEHYGDKTELGLVWY